jgi:hypothetical protein
MSGFDGSDYHGTYLLRTRECPGAATRTRRFRQTPPCSRKRMPRVRTSRSSRRLESRSRQVMYIFRHKELSNNTTMAFPWESRHSTTVGILSGQPRATFFSTPPEKKHAAGRHPEDPGQSGGECEVHVVRSGGRESRSVVSRHGNLEGPVPIPPLHVRGGPCVTW